MSPETNKRAVGAVVVLAGGDGAAMRSARPALLHEIAGTSLLGHALRATAGLGAGQTVVVVPGEQADVAAHLAEIAPAARVASQGERRGTGAAVAAALAELGGVTGDVVLTCGDVPLLTAETLAALHDAHRAAGADVTVLTAMADRPAGYGRIVRDADDRVERVVEERDATDAEKTIREVAGGAYVVAADVLREHAATLTELPDVVALAAGAGRRVATHAVADALQVAGVHDRVQLARLGKEMNRRLCERWMREGVTIMDPDTTWIEASVTLAPDVTLLPNVMLQGTTTVAAGATIGPDTTLIDCEVGEGATVVRAHGVSAVIGPEASIGPYVSMRVGTVLARKAKLGTFVETKNAQVGEGAKVPHLCYAGDARIDEGANIGAGTIFANYDGVNKSITHVGRYSFVGSNSVLVAPVDIADGAYVAAGSALAADVAVGELAVARGRQHNSPGWVAKRRRGTKTEAAAQAAGTPGVHPEVQKSRDAIAAKAEENK